MGVACFAVIDGHFTTFDLHDALRYILEGDVLNEDSLMRNVLLGEVRRYYPQYLRRLVDYHRGVGVGRCYLRVVGHKTVSLQLTHRKDTDNKADFKKNTFRRLREDRS